MLLESTVCLCSSPVPSHTAGMIQPIISFDHRHHILGKVKGRFSVHLSGRIHCRAHSASGPSSPPPSCLEDRRSRRSCRPPQNELWTNMHESHVTKPMKH
ncbi:hypothetical protein XENOCAPTIV_026339 [Xenoophorus captivus]|uniref:Uncharacterized protein n=1 Tax=Xenoophorus captivus TaxID=1517983 RepID=A0ABV0RLM7_9TELE